MACAREDSPSKGKLSKSLEIRIYDEAIQKLYGIGLKLEYCMLTLDSGTDQAAVGLNDVLGNIEEVIANLRDRIYELN